MADRAAARHQPQRQRRAQDSPAGTTWRPTVSSPNITSISAEPVIPSPTRSGGPGVGRGTRGIFHATSTKPITPIGTFIKNTPARRTGRSRMPPIGGPVIGPSSAGMVSQAMAESMSFFGISRSSSSRPTGTIIAPPTPCSSRKAISSPKPLATARTTRRRQRRSGSPP